MIFFADFHVHSKYSLATSNATLFSYAYYSSKKGLSVIATGDFTYPKWFHELKTLLIQKESGLLQLKETKKLKNPPQFILSAEVSCISGNKRVHILILVPSFDKAKAIQKKLSVFGNLQSNGRPILKLHPKNLLEIVLEHGEENIVIPAHIWTPWYSILGSKSGFNSIEECFRDLTSYIYALETGLSSDIYMNRLVGSLDKFKLISNSDAHSPDKIGREATIFDTEINYYSILNALKTSNGYKGTIEFLPELGKYHFDGHRKCGIMVDPAHEKIELCPKCKKPLTKGVLNRILSLSTRKKPIKDTFITYYALPLKYLLALIMNNAKIIETEYENLTKDHSEFEILINGLAKGKLKEVLDKIQNRQKLILQPGYDGKYGKLLI